MLIVFLIQPSGLQHFHYVLLKTILNTSLFITDKEEDQNMVFKQNKKVVSERPKYISYHAGIVHVHWAFKHNKIALI